MQRSLPLFPMKEFRDCLWLLAVPRWRCRLQYAVLHAANRRWIHIFHSRWQLPGQYATGHVGCDLTPLSTVERQSAQGSRCMEPRFQATQSMSAFVQSHVRDNDLHARSAEPQVNFLVQNGQKGIVPAVKMYRRLLKECTKTKSLSQAKQVYAHLAKRGSEWVEHLGDIVVVTFVKCGGLSDALQIFHSLAGRTVVSWTAMISGHVNIGQGQEAIAMYQLMREEGLEPDKYTFVAVLRACGSISALQEGKCIHAEVLRNGCVCDLFVSTCLLDMYGKCGSIMDAKNVFYSLYERDVVSWNAMLAAYASQDRGENTLQLYQEMLQEGVCPDHRTLVSVIQACGMIADMEENVIINGQPTKAKSFGIGRVMHIEALKQGCLSDVFVGSTLMSMYGKCGSLMDVQNVFNLLDDQNVVSWNAMLSAFIEMGHEVKSLQLYGQMIEDGVCPDRWTFIRVIQACGMAAEKEEDVAVDLQLNKLASLEKGKAIQFEAWKNGHNSDVFVGNNLVSMYGKCKSVVDAQTVFDELTHPDVVSWNAMLAAYAQKGERENALLFYENMLEHGQSPNNRTFASVLQVCAMLVEEDHVLEEQSTETICLERGKIIHHEALRRGYELDVFVASSLVSMYGKCGTILDAQHVFDRLSERSVVSYNAMLVAYLGLSSAENVLLLYGQILEEGLTPDDRTFVSALQACGILAEEAENSAEDVPLISVRFLDKGKAIHAEAWRRGYRSDVFVCNTLVSMYSKCRSPVDAQNVFDSASQRDVVSWNAMLVAYSQQGQAQRALLLYEQMLEEGVNPDNWTFVGVVEACGLLADKEDGMQGQYPRMSALAKGKAIHAEAWKKGYKPDVLIGNTLVSMYGKCESIDDAQNTFDDLSERYVSAWNTMLVAYVHRGMGEKALHLYRQMQEDGSSLNLVTLVCVLQACSSAGSWDVCNQLHQHLVTTGFELNLFLANTLIHAYGACGGIVEAQNLFDALPEADVVSWNALISGYARQGDTLGSLRCYQQLQLAGLEPDGLTFLSLISACSHAGLVDQGLGYFELMWRDCGIAPEMEHYVCMVDLLGRAGCFTMVEDFLLSMPIQPSVTLWMCLLGACRKHGNVELGSLAFDFAVHLQPQASAAYVLMVNIYAHAGLWEEAKDIDESRHRAGAGKKIGQTWIGHETDVHSYVVGEPKLPQHEALSHLLKKVKLKLRS